jgi:Ca2+-binding EF-hand superfamily protein
MRQQKSTLLAICMVAILFATGLSSLQSLDQKSGAQIASNRTDKLTAGEQDVKELLLLVGPDQNGKVSRDEFMRFMEAEFTRLDKDHSGQVDLNRIENSMTGVVPAAKLGK